MYRILVRKDNIDNYDSIYSFLKEGNDGVSVPVEFESEDDAKLFASTLITDNHAERTDIVIVNVVDAWE